VQVHNGAGGSPWTPVINTHGSGGSYLATSSKAADRYIEVRSSLGPGQYSLYVFLPIPVNRNDLSNSVPYSFGNHTVWIDQREKSSGDLLRLEMAGTVKQTSFFLDPPTARIDTLGSGSGLVVADTLRFCQKTNVPADVDPGSASSFASNPLAVSGFVVAGVIAAAIGVFALIRMVKKRRNKSQSNASLPTLAPAGNTSAVQLTEVHTEGAQFGTNSAASTRNLHAVEHMYAEMAQGEMKNSTSSSA